MGNAEQMTERLSDLYLVFVNATRPIPASEVHERLYSGASKDTFERQFRRDRERLESGAGLVLVRVDDMGSQGGWLVDREKSLATTDALLPQEALALDVACRPLIDDPTFPYQADLVSALAKVDRSFTGALPGRTPQAPTEDATFAALLEAHDKHRWVAVRYTDARSTASEPKLAPYGFFGLRDGLYVVAASDSAEQQDGSPAPPHVFKMSRFTSVKILSTSFELPRSFSVEDYVSLPFQLGETRYEAMFAVPTERKRDLEHDSINKGRFSEDGRRWFASVADTDVAASWAIAEGITPLQPAELVDSWRRVLKEATGHGKARA